MEDLKKSLRDVSEMVSTRMEEFQQRLIAAQYRSPSLEQTPLARELETFESFVLFCLENLQSQMAILFRVQDEQEMRSRRKCLLLHGVNEAKDESPASIANMISILLKCPNVTECLTRCHRVGLRSNEKPRPILLKFREHADKLRIWAAKTSLKGTGITLSEFLTKTRHSLFMEARKRFGVSKCWTQDGRVQVFGADGKLRRISSLKELDSVPGSIPSSSAADDAKRTRDMTRNKKVPKKGH
ncbi:uncharacterized protein LOC123718313 [Pieris brassicae]|uniref:uncharacterized protein LOC123718313 n=1 Tax=Pieris brassicae TaxID=7116 RepID=UPI001E660676|nr:uncharacterized protein LOC123718313 [Pieris brassicae]